MPKPDASARDSRITRRRGKCFGRSAAGGPVGDCKRPPRWVTTQVTVANPIWACSHHLTWLIGLRTSPGHSITVTRLEVSGG